MTTGGKGNSKSVNAKLQRMIKAAVTKAVAAAAAPASARAPAKPRSRKALLKRSRAGDANANDEDERDPLMPGATGGGGGPIVCSGFAPELVPACHRCGCRAGYCTPYACCAMALACPSYTTHAQHQHQQPLHHVHAPPPLQQQVLQPHAQPYCTGHAGGGGQTIIFR